jgi:hypothetical protein
MYGRVYNAWIIIDDFNLKYSMTYFKQTVFMQVCITEKVMQTGWPNSQGRIATSGL